MGMGIPYVQLFMFLCFYHVLSTEIGISSGDQAAYSRVPGHRHAAV